MLLAHIKAERQVCLASREHLRDLCTGTEQVVLFLPLLTFLHSYPYSHIFIVIAVLHFGKVLCYFFKLKKTYISASVFSSYILWIL